MGFMLFQQGQEFIEKQLNLEQSSYWNDISLISFLFELACHRFLTLRSPRRQLFQARHV